MKKVLIIVPLFLVAIVLSYALYESIMEPIRFHREKTIRYKAAIVKLNQIKKAQKAYSDVTGIYAPTFDSLYEFIDTAKFKLTETKTVSKRVYDSGLRITKNVEEKVTKVLGYKNVKDSLFSEGKYKELHLVPFTEGKEFVIQTDTIVENDITFPVYEVSINKEVILNGLDKYLIDEELDAFDVKGETLKIGSLEAATDAGNWTKDYEIGLDEDE